MTKLTIIRGPSGTGKSTIAAHLGGSPKINWFETDMFFDRNGHYEFDGNKLRDANEWCEASVYETLDNNKNVIVSNTMVSQAELDTYMGIADYLGADVEIIKAPMPWDIDQLRVRNIHYVPTKAIRRMIQQYSPHHSEIEWNDMSIFEK